MPGCSRPPKARLEVVRRVDGRGVERVLRPGQGRADHLEGDAPVELGVQRQINHTHAALPQGRELQVALGIERAQGCANMCPRFAQRLGLLLLELLVNRTVQAAAACQREAGIALGRGKGFL